MLSGALEAGTEALFGGIAGIGKGLLDDTVGEAAGKLVSGLGLDKAGKVLSVLSQNGMVRRLAGSLGEGVESILPTLLTPYLARLTYDEDAANATVDEIAYNILIEGLTSLVFQGASGLAGNKNPASGEAGTYRAAMPQNVELPTVPIINLSMQDVADLNGGVLPQAGNYIRKTAYEDTVHRLGLAQNEAVYIEASNITRNGDAYVINSLNRR